MCCYSLHKFLLQPRGARLTVENKNVEAEQKTSSLKSKNAVRKLRVEGKLLFSDNLKFEYNR